MGDLLPCPFCGGEARLIECGDAYVECSNCGSEGSWNSLGRADLAIAAWNRRAPGWHPISTAPRDGRPVLAATPSKTTPFIVRWDGFDWIDAGLGLREPTHWQPLPPAPEPTP
jgi:hypothetical protein